MAGILTQLTQKLSIEEKYRIEQEYRKQYGKISNYTKWLPISVQNVNNTYINCRNCGANSYKNNKCLYCGT